MGNFKNSQLGKAVIMGLGLGLGFALAAYALGISKKIL